MGEMRFLWFAAILSMLITSAFAGDFSSGVPDPMDDLSDWTVVRDVGSNTSLSATVGRPPGSVEFTADGAQYKLVTANGTTSADDIEVECDFYLNEGAPGSFGANGIIFGLQTGVPNPYGYMVVYDYRNQQFIAQLFNGWLPISDLSQTTPFSMTDRTWYRWKVKLDYTERTASIYVNDSLVKTFEPFDFSAFPTPPPDWEENGPVGVYSRHDGQCFFDNFKWGPAAPPPPPLAAAKGWEAYK